MKYDRRLLVICAIAVPFLHAGWGRAADDLPGVKIGEKAPEFKLKDQSGKLRTLSDLRKEKPVAVVFHRSADW